ncbi:MAG: DUF2070 family protein [Candidatus Korarchaeum sp.]|nr:DUF2070 family protein [Candidatus Korarchaeum sp.]
MSSNSALDLSKKRSKDIFSLPRLRWAIVFTLAVILSPILLTYLFKGTLMPQKYLVIHIIIPVISLILLYKGERYLDLRRALWSSVFISFPLVVDSALNLLGVPLYSMSYTVVFLASLISESISRNLRVNSLPLVVSTLFLLIEPTMRTLLSILTALVSFYLLRSVVSDVAEDTVGLKGFDIVRVLAELVLSGESETLEKALEKKSEEEKVSFDLIVLGKNALVMADIHPGPFRFGSYDLPFRVVDRLATLGSDSIFLRRVCSHERDLPSRRIVEKFLGEISSCYERAYDCCLGKLVYERSDHFEVTAQRICNSIIFTVSGFLLKSFEDIPNSFEKILSKILGVDVSIIDRHDSLVDEWYVRALPENDLGEELLDVLLRAGREASSSECYKEVSVGFSKSDPRWRSVGRGGVRALSISADGEIVTYLSIDCNNMVPELRSLLGFNAIDGTKLIVCTTDTHETLSTKVTYNALGSECKGDIDCITKMAEYLKDLVRESLNGMRNVKARYYRGYSNLPLLGEENIRSLASLIRFSSIAKKLILISLLPQLIILFI